MMDPLTQTLMRRHGQPPTNYGSGMPPGIPGTAQPQVMPRLPGPNMEVPIGANGQPSPDIPGLGNLSGHPNKYGLGPSTFNPNARHLMGGPLLSSEDPGGFTGYAQDPNFKLGQLPNLPAQIPATPPNAHPHQPPAAQRFQNAQAIQDAYRQGWKPNPVLLQASLVGK